MKRVGDIWFVSYASLTGSCGVAEITVDQGINRNSPRWQSIKDPSDRRCRLIRYDTMADRYKTLVRQRLCGGLEPWEVQDQKKSEVLSERYTLIELLEQVLEKEYLKYFRFYPKTDMSRDAEHKQKCLARAAAVIELLGTYIQERKIKESTYAPYDEVIDWFNQDGNYDHYFSKKYLPLHRVRLKEKVVQRFGKHGVAPQPITEVIKLPREGNKSRDKFASDTELMAWIAILRSDPKNDTNEFIIRKIQEVCRITEREVPSNSWFSQVLASGQMKHITAPTRFGVGSKLAGRYTPYITMAKALYAGDCWMMDATRVNFIEHTVSKEDKPRFLFIVVVRDAYSGQALGVHFDTKEDRWGYSNALKMAVKTTGYLPHTLVHDRFPGHITDEMKAILGNIEAKGVHIVCTHKATSKALLERWFDTLQTVFLAKNRYYYGQGIQSTREYAHRSPEYLVKMRKQARAENWDFDAAWQAAWQCVKDYNSTPISHYSRKGIDFSPVQLHDQCEKPHVIPVQVWEEASLFWMTKVLDIDRDRIEHEVHGKVYRYHIYDRQILYRFDRVAIRYEEADPTKVMVFSVGADDRVSDNCICELTHTGPVVMYGPDAEKGRLNGRIEKNKQLQDGKKADLKAITDQAVYDPEYLLNLGGRVSKEEYEGAQDALIYEQMGVALATESYLPANSKKGRVPKEKPVPPNTEPVPFDPQAFVKQTFFNQ